MRKKRADAKVKRYLAFDLGAESGRCMLGQLDGGTLEITELLRFPNGPVNVNGTLYWDILGIYKNMLEGLSLFARRYGPEADGIGVDSWALDFGLLDKQDNLLQNPVCYRDGRTEGMVEAVSATVEPGEIFRRTGLNVNAIHTLFQLKAVAERSPEVLERTACLLNIPSLLACFLCGAKVAEHTLAGTTQLYDPRTRAWDAELLGMLDLPVEILPEIVEPGTLLGELSEAAKAATGLTHAPVFATCTHDTAAAVASVPGEGEDWAFISSGTWSVFGTLSAEVITSDRARAAGVCNEPAFGGNFVCKNLMGLWLLQQARASWRRQGKELSYGELAAAAWEAPKGGPLVSVAHPGFLVPSDMVEEIQRFCRATGQTAPDSVPEVTRCILESLALCYRQSLEDLRAVTGKSINRIHVVGGGSLNQPLCRFTAAACGVPVAAGPKQATAAGNLLTQAAAELGGPEGIRSVVKNSFPLKTYGPVDDDGYWKKRYETYLRIEASGLS